MDDGVAAFTDMWKMGGGWRQFGSLVVSYSKRLHCFLFLNIIQNENNTKCNINEKICKQVLTLVTTHVVLF